MHTISILCITNQKYIDVFISFFLQFLFLGVLIMPALT